MNEIDFIDKIKAGDQLAFSKLYEEYKPMVELTLWGMFKNSYIVEDLTTEVFIKIFKRIETYDMITPLKVWIKAITTNTGIDYIRSTAHRIDMNSISTDDNESLVQIADTTLNAEENIIALENETIFKKRKLKINSDFQQVLELYTQGLSYHEIAEKTNLSIGTIKSRIHRAKKRLKKLTV